MTAHPGVNPLWRAVADGVEGRAQRPSTPTTLTCAALILCVKFALATAGFARTLRWIRRATPLPTTEPGDSSAANADVAQHTGFVVALAAALYPGRALCLEQSLVLYLLLRRAAIDARLRLGVQTHPFLAHSWVELAGNPVNDFPEHVSRFVVLPELAT